MVWIAEKKVFYVFYDLGFESVEIPVRVKFEFEIKEGVLVADSISKTVLYNRPALQTRYPNLDLAGLQRSIENKVDRQIQSYPRACGMKRSKK